MKSKAELTFLFSSAMRELSLFQETIIQRYLTCVIFFYISPAFHYDESGYKRLIQGVGETDPFCV